MTCSGRAIKKRPLRLAQDPNEMTVATSSRRKRRDYEEIHCSREILRYVQNDETHTLFFKNDELTSE